MDHETGPGGGDGSEDHVTDELLVDLLNGLLPRSQAQHVLAHVHLCPACEELLRLRAAEYENLRAREVPPPLEHRAATAAGPVPVDGLGSHAVRTRHWRLPATLVAAAAVIVLVLLGRRGPEAPTTPSYWIPAGRELVQIRSGLPQESSENLQAAIEAYEAHDARGAIELLEGVSATGPVDDLRRIYLASAQTELHDYAAARATLAAVESQRLPPPWRDEMLWIRYIALQGDGAEGEAAALLDSLSTRAGAIGDLARARKGISPPR